MDDLFRVCDYSDVPYNEVTSRITRFVWFSALELCDAIILSTSAAYEPHAVKAIRGWFNEDSKTVHVVPPLSPTNKPELRSENNFSQYSEDIANFMSTIMISHGPKSLLYVCSCSHFTVAITHLS